MTPRYRNQHIAFNCKEFVSDASCCLQQEFGIASMQSTYCLLRSDHYLQFTCCSGLDQGSQSVYLPRQLAAVVNEDSEFVASNLLHEYFGHGLYCEYARPGKQIVSLEKRLQAMEETGRVSDQQYLDLRDALTNVVSAQHASYEGFAVWMEGQLAKKIGVEQIFNKKLALPESAAYAELLEQYCDLERQYGSHALLYHLGFPKYYDANVLQNILSHFYRGLQSIEFALLYGSKKPHSDIDIFIISDNVKSDYNHWLDINARSCEEFTVGIQNFDISITDPVMTGEVIIGEKSVLEGFRSILSRIPITADAIAYNLQKSDEKRALAFTYPEGSPEREYGLRIHKTHGIVARALQQGKKLLTLQSIREAGYDVSITSATAEKTRKPTLLGVIRNDLEI